jgi:hypothetical protein
VGANETQQQPAGSGTDQDLSDSLVFSLSVLGSTTGAGATGTETENASNNSASTGVAGLAPWNGLCCSERGIGIGG